jgi:hypothetical protein
MKMFQLVSVAAAVGALSASEPSHTLPPDVLSVTTSHVALATPGCATCAWEVYDWQDSAFVSGAWRFFGFASLGVECIPPGWPVDCMTCASLGFEDCEELWEEAIEDESWETRETWQLMEQICETADDCGDVLLLEEAERLYDNREYEVLQTLVDGSNGLLLLNSARGLLQGLNCKKAVVLQLPLDPAALKLMKSTP